MKRCVPLEKTVFLHEDSPECKYGKLCEIINCMFQHNTENYYDDSRKSDDKESENVQTVENDITCEYCDFLPLDELSLQLHYE